MRHFLLCNVHQVGPFHWPFGLSHCICGQPLDPMGIHLFCWVDGLMVGRKWCLMIFVQNAFTSIARYVDFHVACEQTHVLSSLVLKLGFYCLTQLWVFSFCSLFSSFVECFDKVWQGFINKRHLLVIKYHKLIQDALSKKNNLWEEIKQWT